MLLLCSGPGRPRAFTGISLLGYPQVSDVPSSTFVSYSLSLLHLRQCRGQGESVLTFATMTVRGTITQLTLAN